jgi:hypothetical protein
MCSIVARQAAVDPPSANRFASEALAEQVQDPLMFLE